MSRYGIDFYGSPTVYGELPLIEFDARPLTAVSTEYGQIHLQWRSPSGTWDTLRVTRDSLGFAPRSDMGTVVLETASTAPLTEFTDSGLMAGKFYYYSVWVHDVTVPTLPLWKRAGDVIALPVKDWGYRTKLFALTPGIYREKDSETPDPYATGRGQLERFLDIPGFQFDHIRTEYESLKWVNDPDKMSGGLLPLLARQLGFGYEAELGMRLSRQQMKNAVHIYKHKGAPLGVEALVSTFTGWAPVVGQSYNLVLDQYDAAFGSQQVDTYSDGVITNGSPTLTSVTANFTTADVDQAVTHANLPGGTRIISVESPTSVTLSGNATANATGVPLTLVRMTPLYTDGVTVSGSPTFTSASANFTSADVNRIVYHPNLPTGTRILSVTDSATVTLSANATASGSGLTFTIARTPRWTPTTNSALGLRSTTNGSAPGTIAGPVPAPTGASTGDVGSGYWMLVLRAIGAGDMLAQSYPAGTAYDNRTLSIPVTTGLAYTISIYSRALDTARSIKLGVEWFSATGVSLGAVTENTAASNATGSWTRHTYTITAPTNAAFLRVQLRVVSAATSERHVFSALQVEQNSSARTYQAARGVRIQFVADRLNLIPNASFEVNTTGWTGTNATLAQSSTQAFAGTNSMRLTAAGAGNMSAQTTTGTGGIPVTANHYYTASFYDFLAAGTARQIRADIIWYDSGGSVLSTTTGTPVNQTVGSWSRASGTGFSPANAAYAAVVLNVLAVGASEQHYMDGVLFESGQQVLDFFDGSSYSPEGEYIWDVNGTPGNTQSYFYSRRLIKNYRLNSRITEFLPTGASWALLYAGQT